ncbi:MAG: ATP-binding protein [Rhodovarius sp.]|nr:hypothetical protein [Rhodovarius sp.]MCX8132567.1 hypothetical protein [Roseococcus sp.]MDW8314655.1 ATP-binding protein [Rhodovarius sp.]
MIVLPAEASWLSTLSCAALALVGILIGRGLRWRFVRTEAERRMQQAAAELHGMAIALQDHARGALRNPGLPESLALRMLILADHLGAHRQPRRLTEEPVKLGPLLIEAEAQAKAQLGPAARPCRLDSALRELELVADPRALRGALVQVLVRTAGQCGPEDAISLRLARVGQDPAILVEAEGAGIAAHDLQQGAPHHGSRGLDSGLSLARSLLRAHGGELLMESAPGIGSRIWLILPARRLLSPQAEAALPSPLDRSDRQLLQA